MARLVAHPPKLRVHQVTTVVAFVSQKGGVGKSTLAIALAREAAAGGLRLRLADLDPTQRTCAEWHASRVAAGMDPLGIVEALKTPVQALQRAEVFDLIIMDGPARFEGGTYAIAARAHFIVHPTGPGLADLRPAVREFHGLVKAGIDPARLAFALNHVDTDAEEQRAREYLQEAGYSVLDGFLPERVSYREAYTAGLAATETRYKALNQRADQLIQSLIDRVSSHG